MIEMMGGKIDVLSLIRLYFIGFYYGSITPGRAGEFIKGYYLSGRVLQTKNGFISILYERFYDITTPVAFVSVYYLIDDLSITAAPLVLLILGTYSISIVLWIGAVYLFQIFKNKINLLKDADDVPFKIYLKRSMMPAIASVLNWACIGLTAYLLLGAFDVSIGYSRVMFAVCIAMLSVLLPVTLGGWGIREAAYVWALSPFVEPSTSIIFSITFAFLGTYSMALLGLLCEMKIRENRSS